VRAEGPAHVSMFRVLCRAYASSLPSIGQSLLYQGFEREMETLPGMYGPPRGCILLAIEAERAVGCVALRPLADEALPPGAVCEMKRMYVEASQRGRGLGHALGAAIVAEARRIGYRLMRLDTDTEMPAAIAVYRRLGFRARPPYNADPSPCTLWFELDLGVA